MDTFVVSVCALDSDSSNFGDVCAFYAPFLHQLTMQSSLFERGCPLSVVVCVARKLRPCPSYSRRRDRNNLGLWCSLYRGGRGRWVGMTPCVPIWKSSWKRSTTSFGVTPGTRCFPSFTNVPVHFRVVGPGLHAWKRPHPSPKSGSQQGGVCAQHVHSAHFPRGNWGIPGKVAIFLCISINSRCIARFVGPEQLDPSPLPPSPPLTPHSEQGNALIPAPSQPPPPPPHQVPTPHVCRCTPPGGTRKNTVRHNEPQEREESMTDRSGECCTFRRAHCT